jgi:cellulose synthase/poly-beta-1,6-N-acetylglucosamine synthase-like glycosyltransferase
MGRFEDPDLAAVAGVVYPSQQKIFLQIMQTLEYQFGQLVEKRFQNYFSKVLVIPGAIGVFRKQAVKDVGYYRSTTLTEDMDLTLSLLSRGWKVELDSECESITEVPNSIKELVKQRSRWMVGTIQSLGKHQDLLLKNTTMMVLLGYVWVFGIFVSLLVPFIIGSLIINLYRDPQVLLYLVLVASFVEIIIQRIASNRYYMLAPVQRLFHSSFTLYILIIAIIRLTKRDLAGASLKGKDFNAVFESRNHVYAASRSYEGHGEDLRL